MCYWSQQWWNLLCMLLIRWGHNTDIISFKRVLWIQSHYLIAQLVAFGVTAGYLYNYSIPALPTIALVQL